MNKSIRSILIANRGEIASRVIRTCRKMGIRSIAVFSDADRHAPFVREADMAVHIGESSPAASYLDIDKVLAAAKSTGAEAIHPGYGFLSENAAFAQRCQEEGIIFIGPHPEAILAMGSKSKAKALMKAHKVPVVPGYQGEDQSIENLTQAAQEIGFPLLLKATAGGGGKGMRIVESAQELEAAIASAKRESLRAFGDDELILEKYIASGRHIEFQIFGDKQGQVLHLLERECTIQRRYQKVVEESPSPIMDAKLRANMGAAAVKAAKALNYDNAGTVEFIYDDASGEFYFLEVNTRLQVEHPVTEEITGLDLVELQIASAEGKPLNLKQADIEAQGYALECRLYAEDASRDFVPVTGKILRFEWPEIEGLRVETAIESGSEISVFYDPMIAKLIVWDKDRAAAHRKMQYVLRNLRCQGMKTNQDFLLQLLENEAFQAGNYDTHFIAKAMDLSQLGEGNGQSAILASIAATIYEWSSRESSRTLLRSIPSGWRNNFNDYQQLSYQLGEREISLRYRYLPDVFVFQIEETDYTVRLLADTAQGLRLEVSGTQYTFHVLKEGANFYVHGEDTGTVDLVLTPRFPQKAVEKVAGGYEAPMPSQVVKILVEKGQEVSPGQALVVISSMKMENTLEAVEGGVVEEIYAQEGSNVEAGFLLLTLSS